MPNLSTLYRIEHYQSGKGPYYHATTDSYPSDLRNMLNNISVKNNDPTLLQDKLKRGCELFQSCGNNADMFLQKHKWHFAFKTLFQLRKWFSDEDLQILHKHGFNLVLYETRTDNIVSFKSQSLFCKDKATLLFKQNVISLVRDIVS